MGQKHLLYALFIIIAKISNMLQPQSLGKALIIYMTKNIHLKDKNPYMLAWRLRLLKGVQLCIFCTVCVTHTHTYHGPEKIKEEYSEFRKSLVMKKCRAFGCELNKKNLKVTAASRTTIFLSTHSSAQPTNQMNFYSQRMNANILYTAGVSLNQ